LQPTANAAATAPAAAATPRIDRIMTGHPTSPPDDEPPPAAPAPIRIETIDDPRVAVFGNVRDRDALGQRGVFIAEGDLVVRRLIDESPFDTVAVFVAEPRLAPLAPALRRLDPGVPVYVAPRGVFEAVVGFHLHRGVLAAGRRPAQRSADDLVRSIGDNTTAVVLLLEDLTNHDNIGGLFRSAAAFGAGGVLLTRRCADPLYRKATRVSIGTTLTLPFARCADAPEGARTLREAGFEVVALTPAPDATPIREWLARGGAPGRVALMLGAEGPGLSGAALEAASARVRLGEMVGADSLNVAVAGAVAMYALRSGDRGDRAPTL